jgi:hypothetical protein
LHRSVGRRFNCHTVIWQNEEILKQLLYLILVIIFYNIAYTQETTIVELDDLDLIEKSTYFKRDYREILKVFYKDIESYSEGIDNPYQIFHHGFVEGLHIAYETHRPIEITPDDIWLLILQGFAKHVDNNSEKLRKQFVNHDGKLLIEVRRDDFILGKTDNDWQSVFPSFVNKMNSHLKNNVVDILIPEFTTTNILTKSAFYVTTLDAFDSYFQYLLVTECGIPKIILKGSTEDWEKILKHAYALSKYDLNWWIRQIDPCLRQFIETSKGNIDKKFWRAIYKGRKQSGGPLISGWILRFFPYIKDNGSNFNHRNPTFNLKKGRKLDMSQLPGGMSKAPMVWKYYDNYLDMELLAGFTAVTEDTKTHTLKPEIGWVIRHVGKTFDSVRKEIELKRKK